MSMNAPPSVADAKSSAKNKYAKDTINASLRYGIKLVETLHSELLHDETICSCEALFLGSRCPAPDGRV